MFAWLQRWQERRITRAWLRETAGDREILEGYFTYADEGSGITVMTPKPDGGEEVDWALSKVIRIEGDQVGVSTTDLRALLGLYGINDAGTVDGLVRQARERRSRRGALRHGNPDHAAGTVVEHA